MAPQKFRDRLLRTMHRELEALEGTGMVDRAWLDCERAKVSCAMQGREHFR